MNSCDRAIDIAENVPGNRTRQGGQGRKREKRKKKLCECLGSVPNQL